MSATASAASGRAWQHRQWADRLAASVALWSPMAADVVAHPAFAALVAAAYPELRMPGPERFNRDEPDRCICAVPLLWTHDQGWVHLADRRPCPLPRRRRR